MKEKKSLKNTNSNTGSSKSISVNELSKVLKAYERKNKIFLIKKIGRGTYLFLDNNQRKLLHDSLLIKTIFTASDSYKIFNSLLNDFSIMVFPLAKGFEGYIKKLFLTIGLITEKEIKDDPYKSIGKIINNEDKLKMKLIDKKRYKSIPKLLSVQWDLSRNIIFHYDLDQPEIINKEDAFKKIEDIYETIRKSYKAFIGDPNKVKEGEKELTSKKLQKRIDNVLKELDDLQKQLSIIMDESD